MFLKMHNCQKMNLVLSGILSPVLRGGLWVRVQACWFAYSPVGLGVVQQDILVWVTHYKSYYFVSTKSFFFSGTLHSTGMGTGTLHTGAFVPCNFSICKSYEKTHCMVSVCTMCCYYIDKGVGPSIVSCNATSIKIPPYYYYFFSYRW